MINSHKQKVMYECMCEPRDECERSGATGTEIQNSIGGLHVGQYCPYKDSVLTHSPYLELSMFKSGHPFVGPASCSHTFQKRASQIHDVCRR